eukprot:TRINITY_DN2967_c0_g2_i3.p1 TRINITY_DN2967_c0_g2~~TRINITY_DN2967_c0_g2_i3.p1  ORF type:complete len:590 (+),score=163.67 TRINITY_DN2967_c0_g2_i3:1808-3577(+)
MFLRSRAIIGRAIAPALRSTIKLPSFSRQFSSRPASSPSRLLPSITLGVGLVGTALLLSSKSLVAKAAEQKPHDSTTSPDKSRAPSSENAGDAKPTQPEPQFEKYRYVIIGGGTAGYSAAKAILERDATAENKILIVSGEDDLPYMRPPLSKELWTSEDPNVRNTMKYSDWQGKDATPDFESESFYEKESRLMYLMHRRVIDIDPTRHAVLLDNNTLVQYEKCLIATGGNPILWPQYAGKDHITTYRYREDFKHLHKLVESGVKHITVIGGGFIGSELVTALSKKGVQVTCVMATDGVLSNVLPSYLSEHATQKVKDLGVKVVTSTTLKDIVADKKSVTVSLNNGDNWKTDHVVLAVGITPANELAKLGKLEIDPTNGGIVTNAELMSRSDVFAAGDVVSYYDQTLGTRRRIEHFDHASASGKQAGENMAAPYVERPKDSAHDHNEMTQRNDKEKKAQKEEEGLGNVLEQATSESAEPPAPPRDPWRAQTYTHQPMFWSEFAGVGLEAVGIVDSRLKTVSVWRQNEKKEDRTYNQGLVYYIDKDRVVGVVMWGLHGKVDEARKVIEKKRHVDDIKDLRRYISLEEQESH